MPCLRNLCCVLLLGGLCAGTSACPDDDDDAVGDDDDAVGDDDSAADDDDSAPGGSLVFSAAGFINPLDHAFGVGPCPTSMGFLRFTNGTADPADVSLGQSDTGDGLQILDFAESVIEEGDFNNLPTFDATVAPGAVADVFVAFDCGADRAMQSADLQGSFGEVPVDIRFTVEVTRD